jgi:hypothetical protein
MLMNGGIVFRTLPCVSLVLATIFFPWTTVPTTINAQVSVQAGVASMMVLLRLLLLCLRT